MRPPREVQLDCMEADGTCTGRDDTGHPWRVRGGVPGARVLAAGRPKSASVVRVLTPAPNQVAPRCAQFGTCGGCLLQPLSLAHQQAAKLAALQALLAPLGGRCTGILAAPGDGYAYRNKLELSFGTTRYLSRDELARAGDDDIPDRRGRFVGMHGAGHFDRIVDTPRCEIADEALNSVLQLVRKDVLASPFPTWEPKPATGFWRHLVLRRGGDGRVLLLVYTTPGGDAERDWLVTRAPQWGADAVCWYVTERTGDAALGDLAEVLHGEPTLHVGLGNVQLDLAPTAFFQVNDAGAAVLLDVVAEFVGSGDTLLDLYCGVGALGLALRERFTRVGGIELNAFAVLAARVNARRLGVVSAYRSGAVEHELPALLADFVLLRRLGSVAGSRGEPALESSIPAAGNPSAQPPAAVNTAGSAGNRRLVVLADPPRSGLHPKALATVAALDAEVLVYVACKPASLARDGAILLAAGWRCEQWTAVDMFPQTPHTEVVARFVREGTATPG